MTKPTLKDKSNNSYNLDIIFKETICNNITEHEECGENTVKCSLTVCVDIPNAKTEISKDENPSCDENPCETTKPTIGTFLYILIFCFIVLFLASFSVLIFIFSKYSASK